MNRVLLVLSAAAAVALGAGTAASADVAPHTTTSSSVAGVEIVPASWPEAVSDGYVAGAYSVHNESRGYVWHKGVFTDLGVLGGGDYTYAYSVNDSGEVVGDSGDFSTSLGVHAFLWRNGTLTGLDGLGGDSFANEINDKGLIIGVASTSSGASYAATWKDGKLTTLPGLSSGGSGDPTLVNEAGQVAGLSAAASGADHAVLWTNGKVVDLGIGEPIALNDLGQVLVEANQPSGQAYAYLWEHGKKIMLPAGVQANALNDKGQVVGTYGTASDGFVWQNGKLTDLGAEQPVGINVRGQILAYTYDNGQFDSVVLDHGRTITLTPTSGTSATVAGISDSGLVAGTTEATSSATAWQLPVG